jgi:hypothetical protein
MQKFDHSIGCKNLIIALVFEKNANFFAENCRKSQKIVIITSTPWSQWPSLGLPKLPFRPCDCGCGCCRVRVTRSGLISPFLANNYPTSGHTAVASVPSSSNNVELVDSIFSDDFIFLDAVAVVDAVVDAVVFVVFDDAVAVAVVVAAAVVDVVVAAAVVDVVVIVAAVVDVVVIVAVAVVTAAVVAAAVVAAAVFAAAVVAAAAVVVVVTTFVVDVFFSRRVVIFIGRNVHSSHFQHSSRIV